MSRCLAAIRILAVLALAALLPSQPATSDPVEIQQIEDVFDIEVAQAQIEEEDDDGGGRKIFVPKPRGAGDTLDDSAKGDKQGEGDVVTTIRGDKIVGKVLSIEMGGRLRLTAMLSVASPPPCS